MIKKYPAFDKILVLLNSSYFEGFPESSKSSLRIKVEVGSIFVRSASVMDSTLEPTTSVMSSLSSSFMACIAPKLVSTLPLNFLDKAG